jgi:hypothetical protein
MGTPRISNAAGSLEALNGQPIHRSTVVAVAATPKDTTSTSGGVSVVYTWKGGEVVLIQSDVACYIEVGAAASMTASGAKAIKLEAGEKYVMVLQSDVTKISVDSVSGTATVKFFELR